jgi:formiminotetrahydrofolate cyclodeaminase
MEQLIELPTNTLLQKFGSGGHKPGSGSAAALLALVSCQMLRTVISLSNGRDEYAGVKEQLTLVNQAMADDLEPYFLYAVQEDSVRFDRVIQARQARDAAEKGSKERKQLADKALSELKEATEIPLKIAELSVQLAEKTLSVFDLGFKSARGDSGVAISSALAAASSCISIIYLNLTSFKGSEWARETRLKADEISRRLQSHQIELFARIDRLRQEVITKEGEQGAAGQPSLAALPTISPVATTPTPASTFALASEVASA